MKNYFFSTLFFLIIFISCKNIDKNSEVNNGKDTIQTEIESLIEESRSFLKNRDIDGDGNFEEICFDYTGGAHCCYKLSLKLSSIDSVFEFPFEMDGGYTFQIVDGSQPDHFFIKDYDNDGLDEIFMEIATYNGEKYLLEKLWTELYGIKTNYILIDYSDGKLVVTDHAI